MAFFILIASDTENVDGSVVPSIDIIVNRLAKGKWPLYSGTPNIRSLSVADECLLYVAGKKSFCAQNFVAVIRIKNITAESSRIDDLDLLVDKPSQTIYFELVQRLSPPISIYKYLNQLEFIPENKSRWGSALQGGCRKISSNDFRLILGS